MLKTKNLLASLSLEIPALEANSEGQLRGGFSAFDAGISQMSTNPKCANDGCSNRDCNCSCGSNGNCDCNCGGCKTNNNCGCPYGNNKTTPAKGATSTSSFGASFLF